MPELDVNVSPVDGMVNTVRYPEVKLEKVLGLTVSSNAAIDCDPSTGTAAYPAGCVVILYNTRKNKQQHILSSSKKTITSLAFSWDGKYLATGECGHQPHVRVWDVQEKAQVAEFPGHKYGINCVAFSPNLKYVISVGSQHDMIVNVWDWRNNVKVASNKVSSKVKAISFSYNGNYFVTVGNRHVKFWYLEYSRSTKYKLEPVPLMGRSAILGDQRNNYFCDVACGKGNMAESTYAITKSGLLCEFNSRRLLDKWVELRTSSANSISVGEDCIFVGCADGIIRCFEPINLRFVTTLPRPHYLGIDVAKGMTPNSVSSHPSGAKYPHVLALTFDDINKKLTCIYNDHSLFVWDVRDLKKIGKSHSYLFHSACIWGVETWDDSKNGKAMLPKGTFLTCSSDDTIRVWNLNHHSSQVVARNIYCSELLRILYMDPELTYICDVDFQGGSNDKVDTTYDGKNGVRCLRINHDGNHLAAGDRSGNIRIYDIQKMEEMCKIEAHDSEVLCLEYSKTVGGKKFMASASRDRLIHVFDVNQDYSFQQTLDDHSSSITAVRFVQNNAQLQMISCGADKSIIFRRAQFSPQLAFQREHHVVGKTTLYDMDVDVQQKNILTACQDRNIRVYSVANGKHNRCFRGSQGEDGTLIKVVLDSTGTYLATSCTDKSLYIYEYTSGECVASMFGHSELVTGLKFTDDGRHLISVSGDGCIFLWKLPVEITQTILSRQTAPEITLPNLLQEKRSAVPIAPVQAVERGVESSGPLDAKPNRESLETPPGYKFSMGPLPLWAKKQMMEDISPNSANPSQPPIPHPRGKWAQRLDGQGLVVKSIHDTDAIIPFPNTQQSELINGNGDKSKEDSTNTDGFEVSPESLNEIQDGEVNKMVTPGPVTATRGERVTSPTQRNRARHPTDSSTASSMKLEDMDAEDEHSDTEGSEMVFYPHSEDGLDPGDGSFQVKATNPNDLKEARRRLHRSRPDRLRDFTLNSADYCNGEVNSDEDEASTPVDGDRTFLSSLCVSTENLEKLGQREKFMKSNYESLERGPSNGLLTVEQDDKGSYFNRHSISAKYLAKSAQKPSQTWSRLSAGSKSDHEGQVNSKRREELTQALNQARKKLEALGWRNSLSTSKSIGDLHSLQDDSLDRSLSDQGGYSREDSIRRTSSMSDLSFSSRRRLLPTAPTPHEPDSSSAPLWAQAKDQPPPVSTPSVTPIKRSTTPSSSPLKSSSMSRSASMGSLNASGLDDIPSPVYRAPSVHTLSRISSRPHQGSSLMKVRSTSSINMSKGLGSMSSPRQYGLLNLHSPGSDSSSSDGSPSDSKPRVSLSKSFATREKGGLSASVDHLGSKEPFSRGRYGHETQRAMVEPFLSGGTPRTHTGDRNSEDKNALPGDPSSVPLTQDLCEKVAEELKKVTSYAIQIFQRVTMDMELQAMEKSTMTTTLAQGVLQAQQNLRPAVPPIPMWSPNPLDPGMFVNPTQRFTATTAAASSAGAMLQTHMSTEIIQQTVNRNSESSPAQTALGSLLQQYSDQLLKMVEDRINKSKTDGKSSEDQ